MTALAVLAGGVGAAVVAAAPAGATLPGWGYEQVTPPDKGAGVVSYVDTFQTSEDGNRFLYTTMSPLAAAPSESVPLYVRYLGARGADNWSSRPLDPPYNLSASTQTQYVYNVIGSSSDLSYVMVSSTRALAPGATEGGANLYLRNTATGAYTLVATGDDPFVTAVKTGNMAELGAKYIANDGRSAIFAWGAELLPGVPSSSGLYAWTAEGGLSWPAVAPAVDGGAMVEVRSNGMNQSETGPRGTVPNTGGLDHFYFTKRIDNGGNGPAYVRTGDETRVVSVSRRAGDPTTPVAGKIVSVGDGGRTMLFVTAKNTPLTDEPTGVAATASTALLYRYDFGDDALTYVGPVSSDSDVVQMTQDGQTVAFQSTVALKPGATDGAKNLYVWRDGSLRFVATADPGSEPGSSGASWLRVLSANGRYLSYTDDSSSVAARFGVDNVSAACPTAAGAPGPCDEVYLYDADADGGEGELFCASCRADGKPPTGKAGDPTTGNSGYMRLNGHQMQTVADDGTVFFTTTDPLLPGDTNGALDVYAYHGGKLTLVSRAAQGATYTRFLDATPDGKTVFLATDDPISPTDTDRAVDIYMTRKGAGFAYQAPEVLSPCVGGECRAPSAPAPPLWGAGTAVFSGPASVSSPTESEKAERIEVSKIKTVRGTSTKVKVTVPGKGKIRTSGSGLRRSYKTAKRAGTYRVSVRLSSRARRTLRRKHRVRVRVTVRFTPAEGKKQRVRVHATFKPKKHRKASSRSSRRASVLSFDGRKGR